MQLSDFTEDMWGTLTRPPEGYLAFVPKPLPPTLDATWELTAQLSDADRAVALLAGTARNLPNPHLLIGAFIRREAVLSSRIEGTQASLSDLFFFEAATGPLPGRPQVPDVLEVMNYVRALEYGLARLEQLPVSLRLIRELHAKLMEGVRGARQAPGEFRRSQNWIGSAGCTLMEAAYVPPPVPEMEEALAALESHLHARPSLPPLVHLALIHYQFEAIHPFLDGNGRIGRLLVSLLLCSEGLLPQPLLYLSAYFERHRDAYYRFLLDVSRKGAWLDWITFFLGGLAEQAQDALLRSKWLLDLWETYRRAFLTARSSTLLLRLVDDLFYYPVVTIPRAAERLRITQRSAALSIEKMVNARILTEITGRERYKVYVAREIVEAVEAPSPVIAPRDARSHRSEDTAG